MTYYAEVPDPGSPTEPDEDWLFCLRALEGTQLSTKQLVACLPAGEARGKLAHMLFAFDLVQVVDTKLSRVDETSDRWNVADLASESFQIVIDVATRYEKERGTSPAPVDSTFILLLHDIVNRCQEIDPEILEDSPLEPDEVQRMVEECQSRLGATVPVTINTLATILVVMERVQIEDFLDWVQRTWDRKDQKDP